MIIIRGAGDIATGTIQRLHAAGLPLLALETAHPAAILMPRQAPNAASAAHPSRAAAWQLSAKMS